MNKYEEYNRSISSTLASAIATLQDMELDESDIASIIADALWYSDNNVVPDIFAILAAYETLDEYPDILDAFTSIYRAGNTAKQGKELGYLPRSYDVGKLVCSYLVVTI